MSIDRSFIAPLLGKKPAAAAPAVDLDRLTGLYWSEDDEMYRAVTRDGDHLKIEIPGITIAKLDQEPDGSWAVDVARNQRLSFELGDTGPAAAIVAHVADKNFRLPRVITQPDLPALDEIIAKHVQAHHSAGIADAHPFLRTGTIEMPQRHLKGTIKSLVSGGSHFRTEVDLGVVKQIVILNGDKAYTVTSGQPVTDAAGLVAEQQALDHPAVLFGDPRPSFKEMTVVGRSEFEGKPILVVRAVPKLAHPAAMLFDVESGLLVGQERIVTLPGAGTVGAGVAYSDFRDVGGFFLPFKIEVNYASPLLGTSRIQFDQVDLNPEIPPGSFDRPELIPVNPSK